MEAEKDTRPIESPYGSEICAVYFHEGPLYINRELLRQSNALFSAVTEAKPFPFNSKHVNLKDITLETGHVIIHYLVTNTYQCLKSRAEALETRNVEEFCTATNVYTAAVSLSLNQLRELAREELVRLGDKMELSTLIKVMDLSISSFEGLPGITSYIESRLISFYKESPSGTASRLLTDIGIPNTLSKVLLRSIVLMKASERSQAAEPTVQHAAGGRSYDCNGFHSTRKTTDNTQDSSNTAQTSRDRSFGRPFVQSGDETDQSSDAAYPLTPSSSQASSRW
ncbi:Ff.00g101930.m01.CDS01 [Fusarium sp. VM40]|nr:Ff.00g101930.m01.CDS01 [Fusarium sp. VM40]